MKGFVALLLLVLLCAWRVQGALGGESNHPDGAWVSSTGFGLTATSGNSEVTSLALTFQATNEREKTKWSTNANFTFTTTDGEETANKGGVKTRYELIPSERFFYFGKVGVEYDKFTSIDLRTSPGGGIGYIAVREEKMKFSVSAGINVVTDFFNSGTRDSRGTFSVSEEFSYRLSPTSTLFHTLNLQNNFKDFGDYLLDAELSLSTRISDQFSLKASLLEKYDSDPFSGELEKNDLTFMTSLNYSL